MIDVGSTLSGKIRNIPSSYGDIVMLWDNHIQMELACSIESYLLTEKISMGIKGIYLFIYFLMYGSIYQKKAKGNCIIVRSA
jgi:hypothetical protein